MYLPATAAPSCLRLQMLQEAASVGACSSGLAKQRQQTTPVASSELPCYFYLQAKLEVSFARSPKLRGWAHSRENRPVSGGKRPVHGCFGKNRERPQSLSKIEFFNGKYPSFISSFNPLPPHTEQVRIPWRLLVPFTQLRHRQACRRCLCEQVGALSGQGVCAPLRRQGPQLRRQARRRRLCEQVGARGGQGATSTRLQAGEQFCSASPEPAGLAFAGRCSTLCWLYALNLQLAWLR